MVGMLMEVGLDLGGYSNLRHSCNLNASIINIIPGSFSVICGYNSEITQGKFKQHTKSTYHGLGSTHHSIE